VLVHPSDILVAGTREQVARARAAIAIRLTWAPAYLTTTPEAQKLEDIITATANLRGREAELKLAEIDRRLSLLVVPYEEWETLYRMRLQLQSERLGIAPKVAGQGNPSPAASPAAGGLPGGAESAAAGSSVGSTRKERPPILSWAGAIGLAGLLATDVALLLTGRARNKRPAWHPRRRRGIVIAGRGDRSPN
jgi:hypothetical protein